MNATQKLNEAASGGSSPVTCSPLFCIDCRHLYNGVFAAKLDGLFCGRTLKVKEDASDLVTGGKDTFTITLCRFERLESGQCGPSAKFWENATAHAPAVYDSDPT